MTYMVGVILDEYTSDAALKVWHGKGYACGCGLEHGYVQTEASVMGRFFAA